MDFFDITAPFYEKIHFGAKKSFLEIDNLADFQGTDRVLDLAGGRGRIAKFLVDKVREVVVADASHGMIKQCQGRPEIKCVLTKAEKLPFPDNHFDKVMVVEAFHHFDKADPVCGEIKRVLKSKGMVIVEELNPDKIFTKVFGRVENLCGMKNKFYSPESLSLVFKKQQFKTNIFSREQLFYYIIGENDKTHVV